MPVFKVPADLPKDQIRGLVSRLSVTSELPDGEAAPFDFRSHRFDADAHTLARVTACSLVACRQQLFMAEGDMALAHEMLVSGYGAEPPEPTVH